MTKESGNKWQSVVWQGSKWQACTCTDKCLCKQSAE